MTIAMLDLITIEEKLLEADAKAMEGVNGGFGGPFGASLYILDAKNELHKIGVAHNRVRSTGDPSAHGEDQVIRGYADATMKALKENPGSKVILFTSAEPCPNCRSKIEIFNRHLVSQNLITPKSFYTYFGANFFDSKEIAGFDDLPYVKELTKPNAERILKISTQSLDQLPPEVRNLIPNATTPFAILDAKDSRLSSIKAKVDCGWLDTNETMIVREQGLRQVQANHQQPWDMGFAILYTSQRNIGPMVYATSLWGNIGKIITVEGNFEQVAEATDLDNEKFFSVIADSYDHPLATVEIQPCDSVRSKLGAQRLWSDLLQSGKLPATALYNGTKIKD